MANYWFNDIYNAKAAIIQKQQQYTRMMQDTPPPWSTLQKVSFRTLMKALIKQKDKWDQELGILQNKADHLQYSDPTNTKLRDAIRTFKNDQTNQQIYMQMEDQINEIEEYLTIEDSDQHSYRKNITKQNYRTKQESTTKIQSTEQERTIEHHTAANIQSAFELQFVSSQVNDYPILRQHDITEQEFATVIQSTIERQPVSNEQMDYPIIQQQHYIQQPTATGTPTFQSKCSLQFISTKVPTYEPPSSPLFISTQFNGDYSKWKTTKITNFIKISNNNSTDIHYTDDFTTRHTVRYISTIKQTSSSCWWPQCHDDS